MGEEKETKDIIAHWDYSILLILDAFFLCTVLLCVSQPLWTDVKQLCVSLPHWVAASLSAEVSSVASILTKM